jgi:hypothetical protein
LWLQMAHNDTKTTHTTRSLVLLEDSSSDYKIAIT